MAECKTFALFIWIKDNPISGNILRLSTILRPRKDYTDYKIGDRVLVKCPGFGNNDAVIGQIGDGKDRKTMEEVLRSTDLFTKLLLDLKISTSLDPVPEPQSTSQSAEVPVRSKNNGESERISPRKSPRKNQNPSQGDSPRQSPRKSLEEPLPSTSSKSLADSPRKSPRKQTKKVEVVKPKPIKRSIALDVNSSETEKKKLKQVAEDLAITSLTSGSCRETMPDESTGNLVRSSLNLLNLDNITTTAFQQPSCSYATQQSTIKHNEPNQEMVDLKNRLQFVEYQIRYMWSEMQIMKNEIGTVKLTNQLPQSCMTKAADPISSTPVCSEVSSTPVCSESQTSEKQENDDGNETKVNPDSEKPAYAENVVYNGYTKTQVMSELKTFKTAEKGTGRLFRMLFQEDETENRSLFGQKKAGTEFRPGLEDKEKLSFLEDCITQRWPGIKRQVIWGVLRHMLKPSRNANKPK